MADCRYIGTAKRKAIQREATGAERRKIDALDTEISELEKQLASLRHDRQILSSRVWNRERMRERRHGKVE